MVTKAYPDAEEHTNVDFGGPLKQQRAYMKFWSQRKPESFALEVWLNKLDGGIANFVRKNSRILNHYNKFGQFFLQNAAPPPIHGIYDGMFVTKSRMRLIHEHEKHGTSMRAVAAIMDKMSAVNYLFVLGAKEKDWAAIAAGKKLLCEPLDVTTVRAYDRYLWLRDCFSAKDVVTTLWTNFFSQLLAEIDAGTPSYEILVKLSQASPFGSEPNLGIKMPLGAVFAPSGLSFEEIVNMAKACIPDVKTKLPQTRQDADKIIYEFCERARPFVDKFSPHSSVLLREIALSAVTRLQRGYTPLDAAHEISATPI